ncbi:ankyrin repeat domain-containing protein [uncultured Roseobacter sp.]|uniref:ankyrin repeat domain-containing protein n=1 Tax=uncultured Roseobacter sp. TaxID=114847 RepID=UPI002602D731|nr:ankyrin repeat domain-containing protein [uncultured Roseobacter sp.]
MGLLTDTNLDHVKFDGASGDNALLCACRNGHFEIARFLCSKGSSLSLKLDDNSTSLMAATHGGNLDIMEMVVEQCPALLKQASINGWTQLMIAAREGNYEIAEFLCKNQDTDVDQQSANGENALMIASEHDHPSIVRLMCSHSRNINAVRKGDQRSALMLACTGGGEVVKILTQFQADQRMQDSFGLDARMIAENGGHTEIISLLD